MPNSKLTEKTMGTFSALLISFILLVGTLIGARLAEQRAAVSVEILNVQDNYYVAEALATLDSSRTGYDLETLSLKHMSKHCEPVPLSGALEWIGESENITVRSAFHCQSTFKNGLSWRFLFLRNAAGYSGDISMLVGIENEQVLQYLKVLNHRETIGYGARILGSNSKWIASLLNQPEVFFDQRSFIANPAQEQTVDAVSGATITARAILDAVVRSFPNKSSQTARPTQRLDN